MNVTAANISFAGCVTSLDIETDEGNASIVLPRSSMLAQGFVLVDGPDVDSGKFPTDTGKVPAQPIDGRPTAMEFDRACFDPVVVELAKRYYVGEITFGKPVAVPTFEEADGAQWDTTDADVGILRRLK